MIYLRDDGETIELCILRENSEFVVIPVTPSRLLTLVADGAVILRRRNEKPPPPAGG